MSEQEKDDESMCKTTFRFNFGDHWEKQNDDVWIFDGFDAEVITETVKNMTFERVIKKISDLGFSNPRGVYVHDPDLSFENGLHLIKDEESFKEVLELYHLLDWENISFFIDHKDMPFPIDLIQTDVEGEMVDKRIHAETTMEKMVEEREMVEEGMHVSENIYINPDGYVSDEESEAEESDDDDSSDEELNDSQSAVDVGSQGSFILGMTFADAKEAREAINSYGIKFGYKLRFIKNEKTRLRVVCINDADCPFRILISKDGNNGGLKVKTLFLEHTCFTQREVPSLSQSYLARYFKDTIYKNPKFTCKDMQEEVRKHLKLHVSEFKCKRAKKVILTQLKGSFKQEFFILGAYIEMVKQCNPGSKCELQLSQEGMENGRRIFRRLFVLFDACRRNWKAGCRPIISLDGCHLNSVTKGVLLTAVGIDPNDQIVPIAWAVVNKENKCNWRWFMCWLRQELQLQDGEHISIVSDMQKGLIDAVKHTLPMAEHRWCARHIYANWSKKWRGDELKDKFFLCAWSTFEEEFVMNLSKLGEIKKEAAEDLLKYPPQTWCRAFQDTRCSNFMVDSNISESFNSNLLVARQKPIISMLEDIRILCMNRIRERKNSVQKWPSVWSPAAMQIYNTAKQVAVSCRVLWNGDTGYEVGDGEDKHTVFVDRKVCTCRVWDLCGIPCAHAIASVYFSKNNPLTLISEWYHREKYVKAYEHPILPIPGVKFYKIDAHAPIEPPPLEKHIGRPRKKRIRASNESRSRANHVSRKGQVHQCSICKSATHKKNVCPNSTFKVPNSSQASTSSRPRKTAKPISGVGVYVDTKTGKTIINPGSQFSRVIVEGEQSSQHDSDPIVRFAIPNERQIKRKLRDVSFREEGSGVRRPGPLPFKPPGLKWKGAPAVTTSQLVDESIAKRKMGGKQKATSSTTCSSTTTN